ncbi:bile acid:sodium symporter family protein [Endozoicomonas gorgoniicola]|uniref:Bile acid:sodium symporter family protein n=1 Tax=Endozoicomonas gorgoniicola TaxID=1234144 RepID=A0ABT3MZC0_9GAMM|nr:bile acid:sodium symporter family protein [Endozoicomonas gorgoniicola]MCW7554712.1 bile acid:sodium symporter family protein [Endozoicomonas gorgoniicola]
MATASTTDGFNKPAILSKTKIPEIKRIIILFSRLLPLWALCGLIAGYYFSSAIAPYKPAMSLLLAIIMLAMGLTLTIADLREALTDVRPLVMGVCLQFILMPLLAYIISMNFSLSRELLVGMILVGTAPGGTASNVLAYLAGGRIALSIGMTTLSTLLAVVIMPLLSSLYLSTVVEVDKVGMLLSILQIIILPVAVGVLLNYFCPRQVSRIKPCLPSVAVAAISCGIALVVALNVDTLTTVSVAVVLAVLLHNILGLVSGYFFARLCGMNVPTARTVAIEVGTQNTGLAVALAFKHFTVLAALPGAVFSITQNLLGAWLASYWSGKPPAETEKS